MSWPDMFRRTEAEAVHEGHAFVHATQGTGYERLSMDNAVDRFAPGDEARAFHSLKGHNARTDTDKAILAAIGTGPIALGFVSNPLLYSDRLRYVSKAVKKRIWGLLKGGHLELVRTTPSQYWLIFAPQTARDPRSRRDPNSPHHRFQKLSRASQHYLHLYTKPIEGRRRSQAEHNVLFDVWSQVPPDERSEIRKILEHAPWGLIHSWPVKD